MRLIFIVKERKTFTTLIDNMVNYQIWWCKIKDVVCNGWVRSGLMAESSKRQGGTPFLPGGLIFLYLPIMMDVNEARKSHSCIWRPPLEGIVALPMLHKDFKVWLMNLFRVFKKRDLIKYHIHLPYYSRCQPPLLSWRNNCIIEQK